MFTLRHCFTFSAIALSVLLTTTACERNTEDEALIPLNPSTQFSLRDTIRIDSWHQAQNPALFQRYNGKTFAITSNNRVSLVALEMPYASGPGTTEADLAIVFTDSSQAKIYPGFSIQLTKTRLGTLKSNYNLTDISQARVEWLQTFPEGRPMASSNYTTFSGTLQIAYDKDRKALSGEVINLRVPIWFYLGEDIPFAERENSSLMTALGSGSTRTVNLKFKDIKVQ